MPGILHRMERSASVTFRDATDPFWYSPIGSSAETWAGFPISPATAMQVSTVKACVSLIADIIARLPCFLLRKQKNGFKVRATDHPVYKRLTMTPNGRQTPFRFKRYMAGQLALRGNSYAELMGNGAMVPIFPDNVKVESLSSDRARYKVRDDNGQIRTLLQEQMLHLVDDGDDPTIGQARAVLARQAIAVSAAAEQYAARVFKNDATGRLLVEKPGAVPSPEKRKEYREMLNDNIAGSENASRLFVSYGDAKFTELGKQTDAAFIVDPRKHQATEICRYWRVQPFMIGLDDKITWGTNIEQIKSAFVDFTAAPWGDNIEQELERALLTDQEREDYQIEFLYDVLLRADTLARFQAYQIGRLIGVYSPNDILRMENRNPRSDPAGDEYQETPVGAAPNQPARRSTDPKAGNENATVNRSPLVMDAATRIVGEEVREVGRRASKAKDDGLRFVAWARGFAQAHASYVLGVVLPLVEACDSEGAADVIAARVEMTFVAAMGPEGPPEGWAEQRRGEVAAIIEDTFTAAAMRHQEAA
jgi:HK97 family phage portal protein